MFSPTKLPCTAWYVTATLNVRECTVLERREYRISRDWYGTSSGEKHVTHLFELRFQAVNMAEKRLSEMYERHAKATRRLSRCTDTVEALQKGGV